MRFGLLDDVLRHIRFLASPPPPEVRYYRLEAEIWLEEAKAR